MAPSLSPGPIEKNLYGTNERAHGIVLVLVTREKSASLQKRNNPKLVTTKNKRLTFKEPQGVLVHQARAPARGYRSAIALRLQTCNCGSSQSLASPAARLWDFPGCTAGWLRGLSLSGVNAGP